jgi:hypothetical protein
MTNDPKSFLRLLLNMMDSHRSDSTSKKYLKMYYVWREGCVNPGLLVCWAPVPPVDGERLWKEMAENLDQLKAFYIHQLSLRCVGMVGRGGGDSGSGKGGRTAVK